MSPSFASAADAAGSDDAAHDALVTLQDAADDLGVHYMTAYRYVRSGQLPATKMDGRWMVDRADLRAFTTRDRSLPAGRRLPIDERRARLRARLLAGDGPGAWSIVQDALRASVDAGDVLTEMILPIMNEIGEDWHDGRLTIAQEHTATAVARRLIARLGPLEARRGRRRGAVVLGAVSTDHHDLGIGVLANLLQAEGYEVRDLGGNVPVEAFLEAAGEADRVVAIVVSCSAPGRDEEVRAAVDGLAGTGIPLIVGGPAANETLIAELPATYAQTMPDAIELLDEL